MRSEKAEVRSERGLKWFDVRPRTWLIEFATTIGHRVNYSQPNVNRQEQCNRNLVNHGESAREVRRRMARGKEIISSAHVSHVQNRFFATLSVTGFPRDRTQLDGPIAKHGEPYGVRSCYSVFSKGPVGEGSENGNVLLELTRELARLARGLFKMCLLRKRA